MKCNCLLWHAANWRACSLWTSNVPTSCNIISTYHRDSLLRTYVHTKTDQVVNSFQAGFTCTQKRFHTTGHCQLASSNWNNSLSADKGVRLWNVPQHLTSARMCIKIMWIHLQSFSDQLVQQYRHQWVGNMQSTTYAYLYAVQIALYWKY